MLLQVDQLLTPKIQGFNEQVFSIKISEMSASVKGFQGVPFKPIGAVLTPGSLPWSGEWYHGGRSCHHQESPQLSADEKGRGGN